MDTNEANIGSLCTWACKHPGVYGVHLHVLMQCARVDKNGATFVVHVLWLMCGRKDCIKGVFEQTLILWFKMQSA